MSAFFDPTTWNRSGRMPGSCALDTRWIMATQPDLVGELPAIIASLEDKTSIWHSQSRDQNLLPTLGPPIISPIVEHVRSAMAEDATADCLIPYAAMLSKAVIQIGRQYPEDAADWGSGCWKIDARRSVRWLVCPQALPRCWRAGPALGDEQGQLRTAPAEGGRALVAGPRVHLRCHGILRSPQSGLAGTPNPRIPRRDRAFFGIGVPGRKSSRYGGGGDLGPE